MHRLPGIRFSNEWDVNHAGVRRCIVPWLGDDARRVVADGDRAISDIRVDWPTGHGYRRRGMGLCNCQNIFFCSECVLVFRSRTGHALRSLHLGCIESRNLARGHPGESGQPRSTGIHRGDNVSACSIWGWDCRGVWCCFPHRIGNFYDNYWRDVECCATRGTELGREAPSTRG